jgi:hypothetical protein
VLGDAMQYLQRQKQEGTIDCIEAVALDPHGGDLAGFVLVKGDKDAPARLRVADEFVQIIVSVQLMKSEVGVAWAYTGAEMQSLFEMWDQQEENLTLWLS